MGTKPSRLFQLYLLRHRMLIFLLGLLTLFISFPLVQDQFTSYIALIEMFANLLLIYGIYIISANRQLLVIAVSIASMAIVILWFNVILQMQQLLIIGLSLEIAFFTLASIVIISHVLTYKHITADKIYGAICCYLLLGLIWTLLYTLIENISPGSFTIYHESIRVDYDHLFSHRYYFGHFLYYSFVTLTTLGYGDITPISGPAQVFSALEGVTGQLYIAVLISRLVGLHIGHSLARAYPSGPPEKHDKK